MQKMQDLNMSGDGEMEDLLQQMAQDEDLRSLQALGHGANTISVDMQLFAQIDALLATLDEQIQTVVHLYFGLDGSQPLEVDEIAQKVKLDVIQVEEHIQGALAQLRTPELVAV